MLLNVKGMAKFWYLATVIPIPKWFIKPIDEIIVSVFVVWKSRAHKERDYLFAGRKRWLRPLGAQLITKSIKITFLAEHSKPLVQNHVGDSSKVLDWVPIGTYKYSMEIFR